jgi:diguanylate cyclase (GGDEF)-like protein
MPSIDRYIEEGIARHRAQHRPFSFEHRGAGLTVSSLPLAGIGRVRIWRREDSAADVEHAATSQLAAAASTLGSNIGALFDSVADGVMIADPRGVALWVNQTFVEMYGLTDKEAALGCHYVDLYRSAWDGVIRRDCDADDETLIEKLRMGGAPFEVKLPGDRWVRVLNQRGADANILSTHVDITFMKRQQRSLIEAERRATAAKLLLEQTLARMEQGIMMVNADHVVEVCNRRAIELLGLPVDLMESKPKFDEVLAYQWATDEFSRTNSDVQEFVRAGGILDKAQLYERERPNGVILEVHSVPISGGGVLRTYTDITVRKKGEERVRFISRHDGLTSLINREVFLEHLAGASARAARTAERFAVLFIDLDRFKPVNDQFGHAVGDQVLRHVADRMRAVVRESDVIARLGGDEFAILQRQVQCAADATRLAGRVLDELSKAMQIEGHAVQIGASIGISHFPASGADPDTLLRSADAAMYAAKADGRDCFRVFAGGSL